MIFRTPPTPRASLRSFLGDPGRIDEGFYACGCHIRFSDKCTPPCSIRFADGTHLSYDHHYRPDTLIRPQCHGIVQFNYDDRDRVVHARHDPGSTRYELDATGAVRRIRQHPSGRVVPHPKTRTWNGARTPRPDRLPHPHVSPDTAMGHALAGT